MAETGVPDDSGFLSRWSRRKVLAQQPAAAQPVQTGQPVQPATRPAVATAAGLPATSPAPSPAAAPAPASAPAAQPAEPTPTMDDVALLTTESSYARFVTPDVDTGVKNAALKKLFSNPHFNVMDGLDTYIDDYNKADPLPASWLAQMTQSRFLGLFSGAEDAALPSPCEPGPTHENLDLRLQPDDAAGCPGAEPGAGEDAARAP